MFMHHRGILKRRSDERTWNLGRSDVPTEAACQFRLAGWKLSVDKAFAHEIESSLRLPDPTHAMKNTAWAQAFLSDQEAAAPANTCT